MASSRLVTAWLLVAAGALLCGSCFGVLVGRSFALSCAADACCWHPLPCLNCQPEATEAATLLRFLEFMESQVVSVRGACSRAVRCGATLPDGCFPRRLVAAAQVSAQGPAAAPAPDADANLPPVPAQRPPFFLGVATAAPQIEVGTAERVGGLTQAGLQRAQ